MLLEIWDTEIGIVFSIEHKRVHKLNCEISTQVKYFYQGPHIFSVLPSSHCLRPAVCLLPVGSYSGTRCPDHYCQALFYASCNMGSLILTVILSKTTLIFPILKRIKTACVPACMLSWFSRVWLLWPMDCSPPGSSVHGIFKKEYWSGLPFPSPQCLWYFAGSHCC